MKITVKLFATLESYIVEGSKGTSIMNVSEGASVLQVLEQLMIPKELPKIILINGLQKSVKDILREGDTLNVFPPIAGG